MAGIRAMEDGREEDLPRLGTLRAVKGLPCRSLTLRKRVVIPGVGRYEKRMAAPLYPRSAVRKYRVAQPEGERLPMLGAVGLPPAAPGAVGYVQRREGAHRFRLAVHPPAQTAGVGWRVAGYLAAGGGWVTVVRRRAAFWALLALAALVTFGVSYPLFRYGWEEGSRMLLESLRELPDALETAWHAFWYRM